MSSETRSHSFSKAAQCVRSYTKSKLAFGFSNKHNTLVCPVRTYQPTYQLNSRKPFNVERVEKMLKRIVDCELEEIEYSEKIVPELCLNLSETIRNAVKEEKYDRYRIIVCVSIGQRRQQSVQMFHSFLWDEERDSFATHNFENPHLFANVTVYGIYLD